MSRVYDREDFEPVEGVAGKFYCPGCNTLSDWQSCYPTPPGCICQTHGNPGGSFTTEQVEAYLEALAR